MEELVAMAIDAPRAAELAAREQLARADLGPERRSVAHQALGIVCRDRGDYEPALVELRAAVRWGAAAGPERSADALATYGATLVVAGRAPLGLRQLAAAVELAPTDPAIRMRRGTVFHFLGHHEESVGDLGLAVAGFEADGDPLWQARALHNLASLEVDMGRLRDAELHAQQVRDLLGGSGNELDELWAEQALGRIRLLRGDLPGALAVLDRVALAYEALGHARPSADLLRCRAYRMAGLVDEAAVVGSRALEHQHHLIDRNLLLLVTATALLDAGRIDEAIQRAVEARDLSRRLHDEWFEVRSRVVLLRARWSRGDGRRWAREADAVARLAQEQGADDAPDALLIAAGLAVGDRRAELLGTAADYRSAGPPLVRAVGWWALALAREDSGDPAGVTRACRQGLDALDEHRETLGSTELRALATSHGTNLATLALRHAAHDPRALLRWSERWRATSLAQPPVTPGDHHVPPSLAALRDNGRRLAESRAEGEPTDQLERDRTRLERGVRSEHHRQAGQGASTQRFDVRRLVDEVGGGCLVELVDVDGVLHVLVVHGGRVRRRVAGTTEAALALTQSAAFVLRRAARGRPYHPGDLGQRLQDELLGDAAALIPDGPATVVPTGRLHGVPWALLPALERRSFGIVPSAGQWLRARAVPQSEGGTVLLAGPGLGTGGAEVPVLAARHPDATLCTGPDATVEAAMAMLDGARLAHVAAHGRFRADSPLFSSLEMADGPLTVYDLERLAVAPYRMVLSACESGVLAPVGADELLGLASALFALGTAGLVCSVAEVNDEATAELMVDLHTHLDAGADPAGALLAVREARPADPTAASFVALGV